MYNYIVSYKKEQTMKKYQILLFDLDDTLLDFHRAEFESVAEVLKLCKIEPNEEIIKTYSRINLSLWQALERREVTKTELFVLRWKRFCEFYDFDADPNFMSRAYIEHLSTKAYPLDGAFDMCDRLHKSHKMYLVTNGDKFVQQGRLDRCDVLKYFDGCFISEDVGYEKPSIEYFDAIARAIPNFDRNKTLIIGDSATSDMQGGINACIDTCWFNPKKRIPPHPIKVTYEVTTYAEIEDILCKT